MSKQKVRFSYSGSMVWLIFWLIVWFPVALVFLVCDLGLELRGTTYRIQYDGSRFWLAFWSLAFFPIALLLGALNGFSVSDEVNVSV